MENESEYIQKLREWQTKQYLPGAFLGGDLSPMYYSKSKAASYYLILSGIVFLVGGVVGMFFEADVLQKILGPVLPMCLGLVQLVGGIKVLKNTK